MIEKQIQIKNSRGIHVRPSSIIAKALQQMTDHIVISGNGQTIQEFSALALLGLCLQCGDRVNLWVDGPDERNTLVKVESLFSRSYDFT